MLTTFSLSPSFGGGPTNQKPGVMNRTARKAYAKITQEAVRDVNAAMPTVRRRMKAAGFDMKGVAVAVRPNGQGVTVLVPPDWNTQEIQAFNTAFATVVRGLPQKFDTAKPLLLNEVPTPCIL